jgi:hypothetical protein
MMISGIARSVIEYVRVPVDQRNLKPVPFNGWSEFFNIL